LPSIIISLNYINTLPKSEEKFIFQHAVPLRNWFIHNVQCALMPSETAKFITVKGLSILDYVAAFLFSRNSNPLFPKEQHIISYI
jgi:hypothetical protein